MRSNGSELHVRTAVQGSHAKKKSSHNGGLLELQTFLKRPCRVGLTCSKLQGWGSHLKGVRDIQRGIELSGIRTRARQLSPRQKYIVEPSPCWANRQVPYMSVHQLCYYCSCPALVISWNLIPPYLQAQLKPFPMTFPHKWPILSHASDFPQISQISSIQPWHALYLSLSCPRPSTSTNQAWFTACPLPGTSKPSTSCSHLHIAL